MKVRAIPRARVADPATQRALDALREGVQQVGGDRKGGRAAGLDELQAFQAEMRRDIKQLRTQLNALTATLTDKGVLP